MQHQGGADFLYTFPDHPSKTKNRGMGQTRAAQWIKLIERSLCLEELMKTTTKNPTNQMLNVQNFIPLFLHQDYLETIQQQSGMGENCITFHLLKHWVQDNLRFGLGANYSSGPGESIPIKKVKETSKRTQ